MSRLRTLRTWGELGKLAEGGSGPLRLTPLPATHAGVVDHVRGTHGPVGREEVGEAKDKGCEEFARG